MTASDIFIRSGNDRGAVRQIARGASHCKRALAPGGRYVSTDDEDLELGSRGVERLTRLIEWRVMSPVVGRTYSPDEIVEAHRFVQSGHKRGGVAITIP